MKKIIFTFCLIMAAMFLTAQDVPQAINFQAIARDANSEVMANTPIMIQLTILDGSPEGELVYREIRSLTTNAYGSFSFQIGRDPYMAVGEFADIDWAGGRKFLKIDYDPTAMLQFNLSLGTVEFVSVPYAFAAGSVSYIDATGANDGDVLAYNATTGRFEPIAMSGAGGGIAVETDPTVPDWAKAENKPTYDYSEIENTPDLNGYLTTESQTLADAAALGNSVNAQLKNVTDPTDAQDAVTKSYVDNLIAQLQEAINNIGGGISNATTGTVNGHDWVDLGLPSGTKWATCNVGASTPTAYGNYYAWGETTTKTTYNSSTYTYSDNPTTLPSNRDAATANWGSGWRMPTQTEMQELIDNCTVTWTTQSGVNGRLFTGPNGNSIFLPGAGNRYDDSLGYAGSNGVYWSSSLLTGSPDNAWSLYFYSDGYYMDYLARSLGFSVRPVCVSASSTTVSAPTVTTTSATNVTTTGATLSGNVTSDGNAIVTARGFVYGTSANNLSQTVQSGSGTGSYTASLTGLASGTTYYYKAYATNSEGTGYGEIMSFTTTASTGAASLTILNEQDEVITNTTINIQAGVSTDLYFKVKNNSSSEIANLKAYLRVNGDNVTSGQEANAAMCTEPGGTCGIPPHSPRFTLAAGAEQLIHLNITTLSANDFVVTTYPTGGTPEVSFNIHAISQTGTLNGHDWVDLGLPSGTKWATCNVGASTPTDYGDYFAWGETTTKTTYNGSTYTYSDNPTTLPSSADAATANWGSGWRMPTYDELNELINNCTVTWTTQNGVNGRLFTGPNGNSIFLPAAGNRYVSELDGAGSYGYYWSSSLCTDDTGDAWGLYFYSVSFIMGSNGYDRYCGFTVRPVCVSAQN